MATRKPSKKVPPRPAAKRVPSKARPLPCSSTIEFFRGVTVGPNDSYDTGVAVSVDCYQWLNVWLLAINPAHPIMDDVEVEVAFELPGKMGGPPLANLGIAYNPGDEPKTLTVNSGGNPGWLNGFVVRVPIIGPTVRVIVVNNGPNTYDFSAWGYLTH